MISELFGKLLWRTFDLFEKIGVHVLPIHYFSPIPDIRELRSNKHLFNVEQPMYGIDMRAKEQLLFLQKVVKQYESEYIEAGSGNFGVDAARMASYAPINALTLYAMIRHFKPRRMIEVGSGMSTHVSTAAIRRNQIEGVSGEFVAIEPFPSADLSRGVDGMTRLIQSKVQNVPIDVFLNLRENDILFIDSTHVVKIFGDVNYLYFNVLPQLHPGVVIHIHDIFFPVDYLPHHFFGRKIKYIWQEQYLLQAFLMFNNEFEILLSTSYIHFKYIDVMKNLFSWYHQTRWPSSFWMQKIPRAI